MKTPEARLSDLGLLLPEPIKIPQNLHLPFAFVNVRGSRVFISGHPRQSKQGKIDGPYGVVGKDNVLAYQWYSLGAMNGSNSAKKSKEYLETRMTPLEIKMAEELTKTCLASGYKDCSF